MDQIVFYEHHGREVAVREHDKSLHRLHCLCYICNNFRPLDVERGCPIAYAVFRNCQEFGIVTPVWECPEFERNE